MMYFAYGSNMLERRLQNPARAPSASFRVTGRMRGYQLRFHKVGMDGSAKCNAFSTGNLDDYVCGVVFDIQSQDLEALEIAEDVPRGGYSSAQVRIETLRDSRPLLVNCYVANVEFIDDNLLPFEWYKALVIAGALEHNLPEWYVQQLQQVPCSEDSDKE